MRGLALVVVLAFAGAASAQTPAADTRPIATIDFFGQKTVDVEALRKRLPFHEGDKLSQRDGPAVDARVKAALSEVPHVKSVRTNVVCCAQDGGLHLFVGVQEDSSREMNFRPPPTGPVRLTPELVAQAEAMDRAIMDAVSAGKAAEDDSQGHAFLTDYPEGRAVQERTVPLAARNLELLRQVLRGSADGDQRAMAAQLLGYAPDKAAVVDDLVRAVDDAHPGVRNNAIRALMVFAASKAPPRIPFGPFVQMLDAPSWTDLNKSSFALMNLGRSRDPELVALLRSRSIPALVAMARWKDRDHSQPAYWLLGWVGDLPDQAIQDAWAQARPDVVIAAAEKHPG
jgi:hypothetical protein